MQIRIFSWRFKFLKNEGSEFANYDGKENQLVGDAPWHYLNKKSHLQTGGMCNKQLVCVVVMGKFQALRSWYLLC